MPAGRPSVRSPDLADSILTRLAAGESLRSVCRDEAMPDRTTITRWLDDDADFAARYTRAKEIGLDERADKLEEDVRAEPDVARARLMLDHGKWYLSKLLPKKYGDKQLIGSDPDAPLPTANTTYVTGLSEAVLREIAAAKDEK